jgi:methylated-DNA-protein-cysteine methyltransferase related protein
MNEIELPREQRAAFNHAVWKITGLVPEGKVATYGQIAAYIPLPIGVREEDYRAYRARWVGAAMAGCPEGLPWQRVINSQGKISLRQGADLQRGLLEAEGVRFDARGKIDLVRFGWSGPDPSWLEANGFLPPLSDLPLFSG